MYVWDDWTCKRRNWKYKKRQTLPKKSRQICKGQIELLKWKRLSLKLENKTEGWIKVIKHEWPKNLWTEDQPEKISLYAAQSNNAVEKNEWEVETWRIKWESINNPIRCIPEGGEKGKEEEV